MALLTPVPLPQANIPVIDPQSSLMTLPWRKYFEYQASLATQTQATATVAVQTAQAASDQANTASSQASNSGSTQAAANQSATAFTRVVADGTWYDGATVTYDPAVAASSVGTTGTGPTNATSPSGASTPVMGSARLVKRVGTTDTVVAGPVSYSYTGVNPHVPDQDPSFHFAGFTDPLSADATTGTISYRVQLILSGATGKVAQVPTYINITRNP